MFLASKKFVFLAVCAVFVLGAGCNAASTTTVIPSPANNVPKAETSLYAVPVQVGAQQLLVQIAGTDELRQQGLSGREPLTDSQGMLFDFRNTTETDPGFWMKDMKFNLDFIWINQGKVIGITADVPAPKTADDFLPTYYPPSAVDMVLEVARGWSAAHGIKIGDEVTMK